MTEQITAKNESEELEKELSIYRALKPYIGKCLTLNHDLNNPLAGIIGYGEFLMEEATELTDEQRGFLKQILTCAARMEKIVTDLSDHKIQLSEKIDLSSVTKMYEKIEKN